MKSPGLTKVMHACVYRYTSTLRESANKDFADLKRRQKDLSTQCTRLDQRYVHVFVAVCACV